MTELAHLPHELSDEDLAAAVRYWRRHTHVVSGKEILATFEDELRKRREAGTGAAQRAQKGL